ncbi:MAG: transglutaminase domain-containing protein [Nannocystaceae bacterium]|nr:transglutaminase-like domain-containing protein [bacterium]
MTRVLAVCWLILFSACAGRLDRPRALTAKDIERHEALAPDDHRGRARFAFDLGFRTDAVFHASQWLEQAKTRALLAEAEGADAATRRSAERDLGRAIDQALATGRRFGAGSLVIDASLARSRPRVDDLAWGCEHTTYWSGDPVALLDATASDPDAWLSAWALAERWAVAEQDYVPPGSVLRKLGVRGNDVRWALLRDELGAGALSQRAVELAATIAKHDPTDVPARVLLELREAMKDGSFVPDADVFGDQTTPSPNVSSISRARRRAETYTDAPAARLHYAQLLLEAGLSGDALAMLEASEPRWTSETQRDLAALLEALARVRAGQPEPYDDWRARHRGASTLAADRSLERWRLSTVRADAIPAADTPLGSSLVDALARRVSQRDAQLSPAALVRAMGAGSMGRKDRAWVRDRLGGDYGFVEHCLGEGGEPVDCASIVVAPWKHAAWILSEFGLDHAAADDVFLWLDADALDAPAQRAMESARDTTLALSSTFTSSYVRALIERGDLEGADAWLGRFGASLSPERLAGLQLTLADHMAGRTQHVPYAVLVSDWPTQSAGYGSSGDGDGALSSESGWVTKLETAEALVFDDDFARAEAIYLEVAEGAPEPARGMLLGLAARAAFEAGDSAGAASHVSGIRADAPERREVEALLAARQGDPSSAQRILLDLWPERPSASAHLLALGVSLQTAPALEAFAEHGSLSWTVRAAVDDGSITTLQSLADAETLADDPSRAWAQASSLAPAMIPLAVEHGNELLRAAVRHDDARPIASTLLALHRRTATPPRSVMLELMLLTGEHGEALSMARSEVPEAGIVPLASTSGPVRLHLAGQQGVLTPEALWREWRWRADLGEEEHHDALLGRAEGPLLGYACMLLSDLPGDTRALPTCKKAWEAEKKDSWQSAVNYTFLLLQLDVPPPGVLAMVFETTPPPPYQPSGPPLRDRADVAVLHQNLAAWLSLGGEHERAAQASIDGYAHAPSTFLTKNDVPEAEYSTRSEHAHLGTLRSRDADAATLHGRLAYQSLRGLRPDVASHYAKVSAALPMTDAQLGGPLAAARARALAPMMADDLEAERIPADVLGSVVAAAYDSEDVTATLAPVFTEHPDSAFVRVLMAESDSEEGRTELALDRLKPLEAAYPSNDLVAIVGAKARVVAGDLDGAKARYAQAFAARPDSLLLEHAELTEEVVGARPDVPPWFRSPTAFDGRLSSVSTRDMMDLVPRYQSHTEVGADAFFPLAWEAHDGPMSARSAAGAWVSVEQDARASRCVGIECLRDTLDSLERRGYTTHFVRTAEIAAGTATDAALSDSTQVWLMTSVPLGGRVFTLLGSAPHAQAESLVTAFALLRRSFAPLDAVVPSFSAASLRADGRTLVDRSRLKARLEAGASHGAGCPITATLSDAAPASAAELVLDIYLASADPQRRHDVLSCAKPGSRAARRLALAALLDDDARLHEWGALAVRHHPSRAIDDAKHLIPMGIPLSAPGYFDREEASPRGRIELGLNLPEASARRWMLSLKSSKDHDARVDAWVIASQRPELVDLGEAERVAREADTDIAFLALDVLELRDTPRFAAAVRARLDALDPDTLDENRYWEARALAYGLVELAEGEDEARLKAAAKRFEGPGKRRKAIAKTLRRFAQWHAEARRGEPSGADPFSAAQRTDTKRPRPARSLAQLQRAPLAELLPTRHWTFARVASPGLFASTVFDLTQRLEPSDPTQRLMVDRAVETIRQSNGFDALLAGGGLDLSAPIECASMAGDSGFICAATVRDRAALLTELGRRGYGSDAGLAIVLRLSNGMGLLPVGLSVLPALLHQLVYDAIDDDETTAEDEDPKQRRYERLRHRVTVAGHPLEYYATIEAEEGSVSTDAERYLFAGDRVLVFSNDFMARRVLFQPEPGTPSLADDPEFIALTRDWKDGSALQAASMGLSSPIDDANVASEVVADGKGIAFRYSATADAKIPDMTNARAHLPPGSVSTLVVGYPEQADDDDLPELEEMKLAAGDVVPPVGLLTVSSGAAFGWYPAPGDSLWSQWVLVLPQNPNLAKATKKEGVRAAGQAPKQSSGRWWYGRVDGLLVLASNEHLARLALERPSASKGGKHLLGRGTFDGEEASKVVARLPSTAPDLERMMLRFFAGIVGIVEDVGFEATWDPSTRVGSMQGRISLRLRDRDATEVVDQWLASARFRNAAALPRSLGADEAEGTLRFSLSVGDATAFADQSVFPSARVSTRIVDDTHLEITVRAKALDKDATEVLTESREKALLDTSSALRIHDPAIEKIRDTLTKPSMTPADKAKAITAWVHERIAYEVTPRSIDATEILEVGRGDCSEYSRLSVSLLRAAGVPAEVRSGMAAQGSEMVAHAWVAYHDGTRWHELDPTWGRMSVTAGHIPLEVTDVLALISLNQLEIETIESVSATP